LPEIYSDLEYGGVAPKGDNIFQHLFPLILITLLGRQIAENFVEIRSYLPDISPKTEWGGGGVLPLGGVTYFNLFLPNAYYPS